jgi:hypothetical protein
VLSFSVPKDQSPVEKPTSLDRADSSGLSMGEHAQRAPPLVVGMPQGLA